MATNRTPQSEIGNKSSSPWIASAALKKLCTLLRNQGDKVLNGQSAFALTTEVLAQLNVDCRRHSVVENDIHASDLPGESGQTFLPLTSRMRAQQEASKAKAEWSSYMQFIKDFMLSTPSLKVIHSSGTISSPISLHRFCNLRHLHLRKIPIHMVEGLHKLRCTLTSLTLYRCVDKLKDIFECCGGDMTAPLTWPSLVFVSLTFNALSTLDNSLSLIPYVKQLDLSHNMLETCGMFLEYLGNLERLTLAFNSLMEVPSVSQSARTTLIVLVLRGNNLDNIRGIEELVFLQELDLGENYLNDHSILDPLSALTRLRQLQLDGNPIFYHRVHRPLTVTCLAPQAVCVEFELDRKKLKLSEISYFSDYQRQHKRVPKLHPSPSGARLRPSPSGARLGDSSIDRDSDYGLSPSSGIGTENESADIIAVTKSPRRSKRKKLKARRTEISDMDTSGDVTSSCDATPGTSPGPRSLDEQLRARREEARKTQKEIEDFRRNYGPNWLQAIEEKDIFNKKKVKSFPKHSTPETSDCDTATSTKGASKFSSAGLKSSSDSESKPDAKPKTTQSAEFSDSDEQGRRGCPTDDDLYLRETKVSEANNPIMAAIARLAAGQSADEASKPDTEQPFSTPTEWTAPPPAGLNTEGSPNTKTVPDKTVKQNVTDTNAASTQEIVAKATENVNGNALVISKDASSSLEKPGQNVNFSPPTTSVSAPQQGGTGKNSVTLSLLSKQVEVLSPIKSADESSPKKSASEQDSSVNASTDKSASEMETSAESFPDLVEEEEVTEAMFAILPKQDSEMVILTLTASYLVEKDIRGKIKEKLDLSSLTSMDIKETTKPGETGDKENKKRHSSGEDSDLMGGKTAPGDSSDHVQLDLRFDYIRRDRQTRCFVIDAADGKIIQNYLQPFLKCREEEEKLKSVVVMQCLKCNRTFMKSEVVKQKKQLPTSGSSKDLQSIQEIMEKPTLMCPKCGSTIIIELDPASANTRSMGSGTSTPVGSYSSASSIIDAHVKRPTSLDNRKSLDYTATQGSVTTKIRSRKMSADSVGLSPAKKGSRAGSLAGTTGSFSRDGQTGSQSMTSGRDRSNAFNASSKMAHSTIVTSAEQNAAETEGLVCVEDHFAADTMTSIMTSKQLAEMTRSLQGDSSTRGPNVYVRRTSARGLPTGYGSQSLLGSGKHTAKELIEEGVESEASNQATAPTGPISIAQVNSNWQSSGDKKDGETGKEEGDQLRSASRTSSIHKNLATMEDIVNALVSEGKSLEEKAAMDSASYSSNKSRSVSITAFKDSSMSYPRHRASVGSVEGGEPSLRHSESSSSITVLPIPELGTTNVPTTSSSSVPATFSVGTPGEESLPFVTTTETAPGTVASPLNSNICSSMVSSVYETSVNTVESDTATVVSPGDSDTKGTDVVDSAGSPPNVPVVIVDSSSESSSEDQASIYDRPRKPKSTSVSKSHSKRLSNKTASSDITYSKTVQQETDAEALSEVTANLTSPATTTNESTLSAETFRTREQFSVYRNSPFVAVGQETPTTLGIVDDQESDETDENDEQDVTPKYAFHHLNHHLTLYMMMSLFGPDEEFLCKIQAEIVQYIIEESYEGILIMSSTRFYILKITSPDHNLPPEQWLHCVEIQPIPELRYVDVGLGGQSLRLEFVTDCSSYTLVTRNRDKTAQFVELLHTNLAKYAVSQGIISHVVVNEDVDEDTLKNLDMDVVSKVKPNQKLLLYCMGYIERGNQTLFPMSFVVTTCDICLVRANHQWPQPRLQAPITIETVGKQFTVLERQKINNIASVEVCEATMKKVRLELFNETEGISASWNITMATRQSIVDFINALSEPWSKEFGVEMDIIYAELDF